MQAYQAQHGMMHGMPHHFNGIPEHHAGKSSCLSMEPDSTVNFFNHSIQNRIYPQSQTPTQPYTCYYSEHAEEEIKKVLSPKPEPVYPSTPEKFQLQESPIKRPGHMNQCPINPVLSPQLHQNNFQEVNEKPHDEVSAFNTVQHHPTYHNNNQSWPLQPVCQPAQPTPPHLHHQHHAQPQYPPMTSFGYQNGHPSQYHETHFNHHGPDINAPNTNASVYNELYNHQ